MKEFEKPIVNQEQRSLYDSAELLRKENKTTQGLVLAIGKFIVQHAHSLSEQYKPKSIIESRFIPAQEAFERGILSCGARVNISAEILRHIGFKVKFIHGECKESVDHAWISVYDPDTHLWTEYDLTRSDGNVPATNKKKLEVDSWEEIKDQIIEDHDTLVRRKKERGI